MTGPHSLINDLEDALTHGNDERRLKTLRRVTDLFVFGSAHFAEDHIAVFDSVLGHLIAHIEHSARAALADRLAPIPNAPPTVMRALAFDDAIDVAGPVLAKSPRLDSSTLAENARTKSQEHLLAISRRMALDEIVTDVLVERGDRQVAVSTAENPGAKFSEAGYSKLVERSAGDDRLAQSLGSRPEIPRHHFLKLLTKASQAVRLKLEASAPSNARDIKKAVAEAASSLQAKAAEELRDYAAALALIESLSATGRLRENDVAAFAREGKFEETTASLAILCDLPVDLVERAMVQERAELVLIIAKSIGFLWPTVKAVLQLRAGKAGLSTHTLEQFQAGFTRLKRETAQQVVDFQRKRSRAGASAAR